MRVKQTQTKGVQFVLDWRTRPLPFLDNDTALRESKAECRAKNLVRSNLARSNWCALTRSSFEYLQ